MGVSSSAASCAITLIFEACQRGSLLHQLSVLLGLAERPMTASTLVSVPLCPCPPGQTRDATGRCVACAPNLGYERSWCGLRLTRRL